MATYEHNALIQYIDENGNVHINYPATKAENVMMGNSDAQTEIAARAKTSDVLYTLEEISACTDFTNKISGAEAVNEVNSNLNSKNKKFTLANTDKNGTIILFDDFRNYNFNKYSFRGIQDLCREHHREIRMSLDRDSLKTVLDNRRVRFINPLGKFDYAYFGD